MRYLLIAFIRLYWLLPAHKRRRCIFKESCSRYVFRTAKEQGFKKAIQAFQERKKQCRGGYYHISDSMVRLADNSVVPAAELS